MYTISNLKQPGLCRYSSGCPWYPE